MPSCITGASTAGHQVPQTRSCLPPDLSQSLRRLCSLIRLVPGCGKPVSYSTAAQITSSVKAHRVRGQQSLTPDGEKALGLRSWGCWTALQKPRGAENTHRRLARDRRAASYECPCPNKHLRSRANSDHLSIILFWIYARNMKDRRAKGVSTTSHLTSAPTISWPMALGRICALPTRLWI